MYELGAILVRPEDKDGTLYEVFSKGSRKEAVDWDGYVYSLHLVGEDLAVHVDSTRLSAQYRRATPAELVLYSNKGYKTCP